MQVFVFIAFFVVLLSGCAGTYEYSRPASDYKPNNSIEISKSREEVWRRAVPALGREFFVINNLDQSSGLINLSYTGDPEKYIDCGTVSSTVKNARGERAYRFAAASARQTYEIYNEPNFYMIDRRMTLEGRVNLIFEEIGPSTTRVTANTRYVVQRDVEIRQPGQSGSRTRRDSATFGTHQPGLFPAGNDGRATECRATGRLEDELLRLIPR